MYSYPLTIVDHFSRYVLCCQSFPDVQAQGVHRELRRLFRHHGLPDAMRSDNGAPERMHRVLKARATKPVAANAELQQRVFNTFVQTYNDARPHEALNDDTSASRWRPSARPLPTRIIPPTYPGHFEVRRIGTAGTFRLHHGQPFFTQALNGEMIGLEEIRDGLWIMRYSDTLLERFDERTRTITGAPSLKKDC